MKRNILLLDRPAVRAALDWSPLLEVVRTALIDLACPELPDSISTQLSVPGASLHIKSGAVMDPPVISLKANLRPDAGSSDGAVLVFDHAQRVLRAVLASSDLTAMRTAAIAGVAAAAMDTPSQAAIALLGAGPVARYVDEVLAHLGLGAELRVWSRSEQHAKLLVEAREVTGPRRVCATVSEAVRGADVVITCTPAREPLVGEEDVNPSALVLAMGADSPGKRELGDGLLKSATLLADVPSDALAVGEFAYLPRSQSHRVTSLGHRLANPTESLAGLTILDSVGSSAVDAAVCAMVLDRAARDGSGIRLPF